MLLIFQRWFRFCADDLPFAVIILPHGEDTGEAIFDIIDHSHPVARFKAGPIRDAIVAEFDGLFSGARESFKLDLADRQA